jgi:hypothetical protein
MPNPTHTLGSIQIPRGMVWVDEMDWNPVETSAEYGLTGALVIDAGQRLDGRPITLQGTDDQGHIQRSALLALHALAATVPPTTHTLTLADERVFTVRFAPGRPIEARPIGRPELPSSTYRYVATLRLVTAVT